MTQTLTRDAVEEALGFIPSEDRYTWVRVGRALYDEYGDDGFTMWDGWSQSYAGYTHKAAQSVWKSCKRPGRGGKPVTIATILWEAQQRGFRIKGGHQENRSAEEVARRAAEREARYAADLAAEQELEAAAARRAQAIWDAAGPADGHPYLARKGIGAHGVRRASAWVKEWVDESTGEVRQQSFADALLVPIRISSTTIASLQAIFPKPCMGPRDNRRDKDYLTDGRKHGGYFIVGRVKAGEPVVVLCEGFATGASIHEATGLPVMVCFDSGNLAEVAAALRAKMPDTRIVIAADNDLWTRRPDGSPWNPGMDAAIAASKACSGVVAVPPFTDADGETGEDGRRRGPTDFNDLHARGGLDAVRAAIEAAAPPKVRTPAAAKPPVAPPPPADDGGDDDDDDDDTPANNSHFHILGYDRRTYFVFQFGKRQICPITKGDMSETGLIELAPLAWWEANFPGSRSSAIDTKAAAEFIVRTAERRGIFDPAKVRGRGAWLDAGRMVYHHGSHLSVDGARTDVTKIVSEYVYELGKTLPAPADTPLSDAEGRDLLELLQLFRWSNPGSAALFAGWVALAAVCGTLPWRPHVWLTGGAGSGKSTIAKVAHSLLRGTDVFAQGDSTEPGIRQRLQSDALPVIMDESESTEERDAARIQSVLNLIRQASTESDAETLKGTADGKGMTFHIRSMFCLASIQVALKNKADIDRLSVLSLRSSSPDDEDDSWMRIKDAIYSQVTRDTSISMRLLRRAIDRLPITLRDIETFTTVAAERLGSQRDGDQYGTLLAGAWSLISGERVTRREAIEMMDRYDLAEHLEGSDSDESQRALGELLESHIRVPGGLDVTLHELVCAAAGYPGKSLDMTVDKAEGIIARYGVKIQDGYMWLSNTSKELAGLFEGSTFAAGWRGVLVRVPGADNNGNKGSRINGAQTKWTRIPLAPIIEDAKRAEPEF